MPRNPLQPNAETIGLRPSRSVNVALRAALMMLAGVACFAFMDACLKLLARYPAFEVAALRGAASLPLVLIWIGLTTGFAPLMRPRWSLHIIRGLIGVLMLAGFAYGLKTLPLSAAYSIFFVAPLLITALSALFLKERVGTRRWAAVVVGLLGVLIVLRPSTEGIVSLGGLAVLGAALGYAVSAIMIRIMGRTETTQSMVVWLLVVMTAGAGLLAWPDWVALALDDLPAIIGIGVFGTLGQIAITAAFRAGEPSALAPLEYTALGWGVMLDLALWHVLPDTQTWVGAMVIVASGLYLMQRERRR